MSQAYSGEIQSFTTPLHAFQYWVEKHGDGDYLTQPLGGGDVETLSWKQVDYLARCFASYLQSLQLPPRSNIVLSGKNTAHWLIADLAIWMAGHVSVPIYPTLGAAATAYVLEHSEARLMIIGRLDSDSEAWEEVQAILPVGLPLVGLPMAPTFKGCNWADAIAKQSPLQEIDLRDPEALATIIYTSGTTGRPKGVMHCFRSLMAPGNCSAHFWRPSTDDRMLSYLPLAHIAERVAVEVPSMIFGFPLFFNYSLASFGEDLARARPTRFFSVPRLWTKFYQGVNAKIPPAKQKILFSIPVIGHLIKQSILRKLGLDQVNVALTGAAPLPASIIAWYRDLGLELLEVFGMSENSACSHASRRGEVKPGYVGSPLPNVDCRINTEGEILVKSPGQMMGYYKMPEESQKYMTSDGYFHTGDRGVIDEQGRLKITGRVKELFKTSKGKYVAPVPIENKLGIHPHIEVSCVTGPGQAQPFALIILDSEGEKNRPKLEVELSALLKDVNKTLEDHERLDYLVVVREGWTIENNFLTPTMKLRRAMVEDKYLAQADHWKSLNNLVIWE